MLTTVNGLAVLAKELASKVSSYAFVDDVELSCLLHDLVIKKSFK